MAACVAAALTRIIWQLSHRVPLCDHVIDTMNAAHFPKQPQPMGVYFGHRIRAGIKVLCAEWLQYHVTRCLTLVTFVILYDLYDCESSKKGLMW